MLASSGPRRRAFVQNSKIKKKELKWWEGEIPEDDLRIVHAIGSTGGEKSHPPTTPAYRSLPAARPQRASGDPQKAPTQRAQTLVFGPALVALDGKVDMDLGFALTPILR